MRKLTIFLVFILYLPFSIKAQKSEKAAIYSGHVENVVVENPAEGTITVNATGFDKSLSDSKLFATRSAFYTLLFRGVPGSKYNLPMVEDENQAKENPTIKNLLKDGYGSFIVKNTEVQADEKSRKEDGDKGFQCILQLTINADALRRYLEQNNVIRKFGF